MAANITTRSDNYRQMLSDILPLSAPLAVYVQSSNACNFRCNYCSQVLDTSTLRGMRIERRVMEYELFCQIAEQLKAFEGNIKTINLTGFGEPLLNNNLHKMVALCKQYNLCQRTEVVSNGSLLTREVSNQLIDAGLDLLRISIQGLTSEKYQEISNVKIDLEEFINNIAYFYKNKQNTRLYIKILDASFDETQGADDFYQMFGNICDDIAVEHLVPVMPGVDYSNMGNFSTGMVGYKNESLKVCPRPFYMITINTDGTVRPCCNYQPPMILGNIEQSTIKELWEGNAMRAFRVMMLERSRQANAVCKDCQTPIYGLHSEDSLDVAAIKLASIYRGG